MKEENGPPIIAHVREGEQLGHLEVLAVQVADHLGWKENNSLPITLSKFIPYLQLGHQQQHFAQSHRGIGDGQVLVVSEQTLNGPLPALPHRLLGAFAHKTIVCKEKYHWKWLIVKND